MSCGTGKRFLVNEVFVFPVPQDKGNVGAGDKIARRRVEHVRNRVGSCAIEDV